MESHKTKTYCRNFREEFQISGGEFPPEPCLEFRTCTVKYNLAPGLFTITLLTLTLPSTKHLSLKLDSAASRTTFFDQVVTAYGKIGTIQRVNISYIGSGSGLWFGFCQYSQANLLYVPQIRSPHFTRGQWLNGTIRTVRT